MEGAMSQGMRVAKHNPWLTASKETGFPALRPPEVSSAKWVFLEAESTPEPADKDQPGWYPDSSP